jgi:hypothetical protein
MGTTLLQNKFSTNRYQEHRHLSEVLVIALLNSEIQETRLSLFTEYDVLALTRSYRILDNVLMIISIDVANRKGFCSISILHILVHPMPCTSFTVP